MAIMKCTCTHSFQDKEHGKGNRVHNPATAPNSKEGVWRCTVCGNIKPGNTQEVTSSKKEG